MNIVGNRMWFFLIAIVLALVAIGSLGAFGLKPGIEPSTFFVKLTRELVRRGIAVDVFTRSQNPHLPHVMHRLGPLGRVIHIPTGPEEPYDKNRVFDYLPEFVGHVEQFARDEGAQYDVIHSHYWLSGWAARELREAWGAPIVQMFHTLGEMKNRVAQSDEEREGLERIRAEKRLVQRVDRIVVSTLAEQTQLRFLYKADERKLEIIPPGVDIAHSDVRYSHRPAEGHRL